MLNPEYECGSPELNGEWRSSSDSFTGFCRWPFRCCNPLRPPESQTKHGSPLSRAGSFYSPSEGEEEEEGGALPRWSEAEHRWTA